MCLGRRGIIAIVIVRVVWIALPIPIYTKQITQAQLNECTQHLPIWLSITLWGPSASTVASSRGDSPSSPIRPRPGGSATPPSTTTTTDPNTSTSTRGGLVNLRGRKYRITINQLKNTLKTDTIRTKADLNLPQLSVHPQKCLRHELWLLKHLLRWKMSQIQNPLILGS